MKGYIYKWISYFTGWTKYYFVLESETLSYYTDKETFEQDKGKNLVGTLNITRLETEIDVDQYGNTATITDTKTGQATFIQFLNYNDKRDWLKHIGTARAGKLTGKISISGSSSESTESTSKESSSKDSSSKETSTKDSSSNSSSSKQSTKSDFKVKIEDTKEEIKATVSSEELDKIKKDTALSDEKIPTENGDGDKLPVDENLVKSEIQNDSKIETSVIDTVETAENDVNIEANDQVEKIDDKVKTETVEETVNDDKNLDQNDHIEPEINETVADESQEKETDKSTNHEAREEIQAQTLTKIEPTENVPTDNVMENPVENQIEQNEQIVDQNAENDQKIVKNDENEEIQAKEICPKENKTEEPIQNDEINQTDLSNQAEIQAESTQINESTEQVLDNPDPKSDENQTLETNIENDQEIENLQKSTDSSDSENSNSEIENPTLVTEATKLIDNIQNNLGNFNEKLQYFNSLFLEGSDLDSIDEMRSKSNECNNLILSVNEQISQLAIANKQIQDVVSENIFERLKKG